jgi:medium-chain acyl-[acyl-carrier-protein] hydrolase
MALMEPVLRADFRVVETREHKEETPLTIPISCFGGQQDDRVSAEHLQGWRQHTQSGFWQQMFTGDHFYHLTDSKQLLQQISDILCLAMQMRSQS